MSRLVALDPGLRDLGLALFEDGKLVKATLVRNEDTTRRGPVAWVSMAQEVSEEIYQFRPSTLVIEEMQRDSRTVGAAIDDLLQVQGVVGAAAYQFYERQIFSYTPSKWKGQVPKAVHHKRLEGKLSVAELATFVPCPASLIHNVWDAVGLGLFHLKQTKVRP